MTGCKGGCGAGKARKCDSKCDVGGGDDEGVLTGADASRKFFLRYLGSESELRLGEKALASKLRVDGSLSFRRTKYGRPSGAALDPSSARLHQDDGCEAMRVALLLLANRTGR